MRERPGWKETESDMDWDFHWADRPWMFEVFDHIHLDHHQRVNHYRNDRELCRKDLLIKNVKRFTSTLRKAGKLEEAADFDFCPRTFLLPMEYAIFEEVFKKTGGAWIMKPIGRSQGKGIFIVTKLSKINAWKRARRWQGTANAEDKKEVESYVVQRYIHNPYLVGGKKFDLRVYALVTSFSPLQVWVYRSGFARFSSSRYTPDAMEDLNKHLTNIALQKKADDYDAETGAKWDLRRLKMYLVSRHGVEVTDRMFTDMQLIIIRSLICVQAKMINDKHCFELYGYDVMFDDELKPWLIEVNASPSLTANTAEDYQLKYRLLSEMLDVIDVEGRRTGNEQHIGGFDLAYDGKPVKMRGSYLHTFMGSELPPPLIRNLPSALRSAGSVAAAERAAVARGMVDTTPNLRPPPMSPSGSEATDDSDATDDDSDDDSDDTGDSTTTGTTNTTGAAEAAGRGAAPAPAAAKPSAAPSAYFRRVRTSASASESADSFDEDQPAKTKRPIAGRRALSRGSSASRPGSQTGSRRPRKKGFPPLAGGSRL